jgi:hypothetical protein
MPNFGEGFDEASVTFDENDALSARFLPVNAFAVVREEGSHVYCDEERVIVTSPQFLYQPL